MKKIHLNLYVNEELVDKAKDYGLVISKFLENQLRGYFSYIDDMKNNYTPYTSGQSAKIKEFDFFEQNGKSNNLNFNSYNPSGVCSVAGYHKGLRSL